MISHAFVVLCLYLLDAAVCCPPSTTAATNCPTPPTCPSGQTCAAVACTSGQACITSGQYNLCQITTPTATTSPDTSAKVIKVCSATASTACTALGGVTATGVTTTTFTDFASCCAATGPATQLKYETYTFAAPLPVATHNLCLGAASANPYYICSSAQGSAVGVCVRFPNSCLSATSTIQTNAATTPVFPTAASLTNAAGFSDATFFGCCKQAIKSGAVLWSSGAVISGLTVETCGPPA